MTSIKLVSAADIRRFRKILKLTQKQLAAKAGVSQSLISRIENNDIDPRLSTVKKIVEVLSQTTEKTVASDVMHTPVITVNVMDAIQNSVDLMKRYDISQVPVLKGKKIVGIIRESTIIDRIMKRTNTETLFSTSVSNVMERHFPIIGPTTLIEDILSLLSQGEPAILVVDFSKLIGIITKIDVISSVIHIKTSGV